MEAEVEVQADDVAEASSVEGDKARPDVKTLEQRIAELEDNVVQLQTELNTLLNKKKNKKGSKGKKVKCKCKDKTVDIAECKCRNKKLVK